MNEQVELIPQNTIRIETALSRFPVHKLARQRGGITIDIRETTSAGEVKTKWQVDYSNRHGQPGALAYKVDTLIINRRIDDERPSIPKIIRLGSLRDICQELRMGFSGANTNDVKKALMQNVGAIITAKLSYKATDGTERTIEAGFSRYSVIFTGERFPDGRKANAVFILLNDIYQKVLNEAQTRPLDYDYLRDLPPTAQRFYELIGFQIYAVLKHERPRARLSYFDFCIRAPQTRYFDWEHVRKQMYKVHAPHLKAGYLAKVEFQEQQTQSGEPDWIMFYTPGHRAQAEFREANRKPRILPRPQAAKAAKQSRETPEALLPASTMLPLAPTTHEADDTSEQLVTKLIGFHVAEATAGEMVRDYRKSVELQLRALPHRNLSKIKDLAAWLVVAIKEGHQLPAAVTEAEAKEGEVRKARAKREAADARQRDEEARRAAYFGFLRDRAGETEKTQPEAYKAFLDNSAARRAELEGNPDHRGQARKILLRIFDDGQSQLERFRDYFNQPSFEVWNANS